MKLPEKFKVLVITLSDRVSVGEYTDLSGPLIRDRLNDFFKSTGWTADIESKLLPDDEKALGALVKAAGLQYNLIITTGGTGIGPRDITIEAIKPLLSKEIPGIMEFIRVRYGTEKPNALLSRGIAGITGNSLIFTLPGSVKGAGEYMNEITKILHHAFLMQYGIDTHGKPQ